MNKRKVGAVVAAITAILATLAFVLPGIFRTTTVANWGVLAANTIATAATIAAIVLMVIAAVAVITTVYAFAKVKKAERARQAESKSYVLPSVTESDPEVIRRGLERVKKKFANTNLHTTPLIEDGMKHMDTIQASIANVDSIFSANPLLIIESDALLDYSMFTILLTDIRQEVYTGLIRIIYQAHTTDQKDQDALNELVSVIKAVNDENQSRIAKVKKLTDEMVKVSTRTDSDNKVTATDQLTKLIAQLSSRRQIAAVPVDSSVDALLNPSTIQTPQPIYVRKETR